MSQTRWTLADEERIIAMSNTGSMLALGRFCEAVRGNGVISGILLTRTAGMFALPRIYTGDPDLVAELKGGDGKPGLYDVMVPQSELTKITRDGILAGMGIGEASSRAEADAELDELGFGAWDQSIYRTSPRSWIARRA